MVPQFSIISNFRVCARGVRSCVRVQQERRRDIFGNGNEKSEIIFDYCKGHLDPSYLRRCERSNNLTFL